MYWLVKSSINIWHNFYTYLLTDIDECLGDTDNCSCGVLAEHECDVDCLNTNGSFYCECNSGFEISSNNTCLGKGG